MHRGRDTWDEHHPLVCAFYCGPPAGRKFFPDLLRASARQGRSRGPGGGEEESLFRRRTELGTLNRPAEADGLAEIQTPFCVFVAAIKLQIHSDRLGCRRHRLINLDETIRCQGKHDN